jgi:hypothetical protein
VDPEVLQLSASEATVNPAKAVRTGQGPCVTARVDAVVVVVVVVVVKDTSDPDNAPVAS